MKRPRNSLEISANPITTKSTKKQKPQKKHPNRRVKEEDIKDDQTHHQSSSKVNQQVTIKKEELSDDDYDTKQIMIKCEHQIEVCKIESKSELHLDLFKHEIKRECIKCELDQDCDCEECIQEQNNVHKQQDIPQTIDHNTEDTHLVHHKDFECPTPDYLPSFFDRTDEEDDSDEEEVNYTSPASPLSTNPTLNYQNIEDLDLEQEAATSSTDHYVRRSIRSTANPKSSYVSQVYIKSSESEGNESAEISDSEEDDEEENQPQSDEEDEDVDNSSRKQVLSEMNPQKKKTELISMGNKKSNIKTEKSGEEVESENEHEPNKQKRNPKRWTIIVHLKCSVCGQKLKDDFELKLHQLTEHQIRRFCCPVSNCSASFEYCEQVPEHKLTEHGDLSMWPCRECSYEGNSYKRLLHHRWGSHQEGHFKCGHDGCQFESHTTRKPVLSHLSQAHFPKFFCSFGNCDKSYKQKPQLKSHIRLVHTGERPFSCSHCTKRFATQKDFSAHVRKVHEAYKPYECKWPNCTYTSGYSGNTIAHIRVRHLSTSGQPSRDPKDFVEKRFRLQTQNNREKDKDEKVVEEEPKNVEKCQVKHLTLRLDCLVEKCPEFAPNKIELNQHLLQCHQIDQHRCLLSNCTASFKYLKQLTVHRRNEHKNMDSYDCSKCNYSNRDYKKLIHHHWLQHEIGHFPCPHDGCDFVSTTNRQKVDGHRYTHVEPKYKCSEEGCAYTAKDKRLLATHLRRHRESQEPKVVKRYDCSKCCRFYPRLSDIVRHEKSHLKNGYQCQWPGCDYFSGDTKQIKLHLCEDHKFKKQASNQSDKEMWKYWKRVLV